VVDIADSVSADDPAAAHVAASTTAPAVIPARRASRCRFRA
jgi:hypothetical protein